jgi:septin 3/9/12
MRWLRLTVQIDITVLKKLADVVNVVPVIAKADSLTLEERDAFKQRVRGAHDPS